MNKLFNSRKFRQGSVASAITVVVVAVIVVLNLLVSALSQRYDLKLDLTPGKVFGITEETAAFLRSLDKDVTIYVLATEDEFIAGGSYFIQASEVLRKYARESGRISLQYVDTVADPTFVARFPDQQLTAGSIIVTCGDRVATVSLYDLFSIQQGQYANTITSSNAEQAMTSAILKVTSDERVTVSLIDGYGESGYEYFATVLEKNNYDLTTQTILSEERISPDADIAVIAAPMRDYHEDDLKKLDEFLYNNGEYGKLLVYLPHAVQPELPNLEAFLADWGIGVIPGAVYETNSNNIIYQSPFNPLVYYMEEIYSQNVLTKNMPVTVPNARPLEILSSPQGNVSVSELLSFTDTTVLFPLDADQSWSPATAEQHGPFPAALLSTKTAFEGSEVLQSRVLAIASVTAWDSTILSHTSLANSEYFLDVFDLLSSREDVVRILPKTIGGTQMGITGMQVLVLGGVFMVVLPLFVLIVGCVVWFRRRHL